MPVAGDRSESEAPVAAASKPRREEPLRPLATLLLFALAAFLLFFRLGALPLLDPDEGRNTAIAAEMAASGAWLVPTYNGLPYLDKPPFYFKLVGLSLATFGANETAARLPSVLFGAALLLLVYGFCRTEHGPRTAALAVAIVAAMPLYFAFARMVIFDMALAFFVCLAIFAGYRAAALDAHGKEAAPTARRRARWLYVLGAVAAGFATLTKGPVGLILPVLVLLALALVERRKGVLRAILHPYCVAAFLAVVLPWFVGVSLQRPDFPYYGLVKETFERFSQPTFSRAGPFYYYLPVVLAVCFAWSVLFPGALRLAWRKRDRLRRADRLFLVWTITVVVFFSLSQSKLPGYVLTAVVAISVLVARLFSQALDEPRGQAARVIFRSAIALAVVVLPLAVWLGRIVWIADGSALGFEADVPDSAVLAIAGPLLATLIAMGGIALLGQVTKKVGLVLAAFFVLPISLLTISFHAVETYAAETSSKPLASAVGELPVDTTVVCYRCFPKGLGFYLDRTVYLISEDGTEFRSNYIPFYLSRESEWPPQVIPLSDAAAWLQAQTGPLLVVFSKKNASQLDSIAPAQGGASMTLPGGFRGRCLEH